MHWVEFKLANRPGASLFVDVSGNGSSVEDLGNDTSLLVLCGKGPPVRHNLVGRAKDIAARVFEGWEEFAAALFTRALVEQILEFISQRLTKEQIRVLSEQLRLLAQEVVVKELPRQQREAFEKLFDEKMQLFVQELGEDAGEAVPATPAGQASTPKKKAPKKP